jgi:translation initiation factor IF-3
MKKNENLPKYRINEEIPNYSKVRLVSDEGTNDVISIKEALNTAKERDMDLIEINPNAQIPIVKIASYEKLMYEIKKNLKKSAKKTEMKEIQLSASIAEHDIQTKANKAREFIERGDNVKVVLTLKGREMAYKENNEKSLYEFIDKLSDISCPLSLPKEIGNKFMVILKKK